MILLPLLLSVCSLVLSASYSLDDVHMKRALELAQLAEGFTSPNPCVGCVIVDEKTGRTIGEGWHARAGEAHAEVNALAQAGEDAAGCTAYVSLEPCNHFGRTPPCTHALIKAGIARVVAGIVDPDPRVSGKGLEYLREKGVRVDVGVQEARCLELNRPFIFRVLNKRSYASCWLSSGSGDTALASIIRAIPMSSPLTDTLVLREVQAARLLQDSGGNVDEVVELLLALPARITVAIVPNEGDDAVLLSKAVTRLIEAFATTVAKSTAESPRLKRLGSCSGSGCDAGSTTLRAVLEQSLEEGSNAVALVAESESELEAWCAEGHCQHLLVGADDARSEGETFRRLKLRLRELADSPSCDVTSRSESTASVEDEEDEEETAREKRERRTGRSVSRRLVVFGAHVWKV